MKDGSTIRGNLIQYSYCGKLKFNKTVNDVESTTLYNLREAFIECFNDHKGNITGDQTLKNFYDSIFVSQDSTIGNRKICNKDKNGQSYYFKVSDGYTTNNGTYEDYTGYSWDLMYCTKYLHLFDFLYFANVSEVALSSDFANFRTIQYTGTS